MSSETPPQRPATDVVGGAPFVIEFVGTPGSGKTTLARELVELLRQEDLDATTIVEAARPHAATTRTGRVVSALAPGRVRRQLLWRVFYLDATRDALRFARAHRELARMVVAGERTRPVPRRLRRHTLWWFFQLGGRTRFLSRTAHDGEILVVDDGFLHRVVALHAGPGETPDEVLVRALVDLLPRPDLVVHVVADAETCAQRVSDRGIWRHRAGLDDVGLRAYVKNAEGAVQTGVSRAIERGWRLVEVDNGGADLAAARASLRAALIPVLGLSVSSRPADVRRADAR
jgi:thymidylate kinase